VTFTSSQGVSANSSWTFQGGPSGSINLGIVTLGASGSASNTHGTITSSTVSVVGTDSVDMPTPPHQYAIAEFGDWRYMSYGRYKHWNASCVLTKDYFVQTWVPENALGIYGVVKKTSAVTWVQNNAPTTH
jgi:hypothetical protein